MIIMKEKYVVTKKELHFSLKKEMDVYWRPDKVQMSKTILPYSLKMMSLELYYSVGIDR